MLKEGVMLVDLAQVHELLYRAAEAGLSLWLGEHVQRLKVREKLKAYALLCLLK